MGFHSIWADLQRLAVGMALILLASGCSVDSAKNHYLLAEKLWTDGKYAASVSEFEKVINKDPQGKLGLQATFRAAMTQYLFLSQYGEAVSKFRTYTQGQADPQSKWYAQIQIGDILFQKMEQYDQVIHHYESLLKENPKAPEAPEFLFRIGKSQFYLLQFDDAIQVYEDIRKKFPGTSWAEKASFEIGATFFTRGEQRPSHGESSSESYEEAIEAYQDFLKKFPNSSLVSQARFGIALCLEELDRLDEASQAYENIRNQFPSPRLVDLKLIRIRERIAQKGQNSRR